FVYFRGNARDNEGANHIGLWRTDCTLAGTTFVKEMGSPIASVMGHLFFSTSDTVTSPSNALWAIDGTTNGLTFLKGLTVTVSPVQLNGNVFFAADDGVHGNALWKTDGKRRCHSTALGRRLRLALKKGKSVRRPVN